MDVHGFPNTCQYFFIPFFILVILIAVFTAKQMQHQSSILHPSTRTAITHPKLTSPSHFEDTRPRFAQITQETQPPFACVIITMSLGESNGAWFSRIAAVVNIINKLQSFQVDNSLSKAEPFNRRQRIPLSNPQKWFNPLPRFQLQTT